MTSGLKREPRMNEGYSGSPGDKDFKDKGVIVLNAAVN